MTHLVRQRLPGSAVRSLSPIRLFAGQRAPQGLYHPAHEHDACGVGLIADIHNRKSHRIISDSLRILRNLEHRGAVGADPRAGDGSGILVQIPHAFFSARTSGLGFDLPDAGEYGVGQVFMPHDQDLRARIRAIFAKAASEEGLKVLGWRDVPVDNTVLGETVRSGEPLHQQIFVARGEGFQADKPRAFDRKLYVMRKLVSNRIRLIREAGMESFYIVSFSSRTIVYKGLVLGPLLASYYLDLADPAFASAVAMVHQRFSTNTFPSWPLAHPYRYISHNGEINTMRGNFNWMAARYATMKSPLFGADMEKLWPISFEGQSDSACFDNALELLSFAGYPMSHAMMMLIPEAWSGNSLMDEKRRAFYEYHAALMEPWDGPAAIAFTDGDVVGATLDRNGLRPARYLVTSDDTVVLASEMGVLDIPEHKIVRKWRLQPGKMLLIDLNQGRIVADEQLKDELATRYPYRKWLDATQISLDGLPEIGGKPEAGQSPLVQRQRAFGYTREDIKFILTPMATTGQEAVGSMGNDAPISALSSQPKLLHTYFKQLFAQVTNPPIDPIREESVMSLVSFIGPRPNLLDLEGAADLRRLQAPHPILTNEDMRKLRAIGDVADNHFRTVTVDITYPASDGASGMKAALERLCARCESAVHEGFNIIILSDRRLGPDQVAVPSLLATSAAHHHLIRRGLRTAVGIVVETGEAREVHQFCTLAGYGAEAINPYLAFETIIEQLNQFAPQMEAGRACANYIKAVNKGLLKVMSKMGISTFQSYCGAQIFDALGLQNEFVADYFTGTASRIEGIGLAEIAQETMERHARAFDRMTSVSRPGLDVGGDYALRLRGEAHAWSPSAIAELRHAVRGGLPEKYRSFAHEMNDQARRHLTIRGLMRIRDAAELDRKPIPLEEVEPATELVKRFSTGAMSFGSISREAHTALAIAMNRIGGKSNTGEGGEEPDRFRPLENGDSLRSAIKQVASGRFGVTAQYLVNADMIQIKMAQGAKPGEGGQLPGHKVDGTIAAVRYSTPGVGLISPPPHHDIYSIEDLAQLIYDLKNVNPRADISVKLVSEVGVGTVAAGVSKARADHVTISGYDGGTGASPLTSIKHAGSPWEIGLAETHQTLVLNNLRGRICVQVDGGLRTGRDVLIAGLLGADEMGFATAPLVAAGCIMMRKCHLNTCPVGIATQDKTLRKKFRGTPEHIVNYFFFVAEELRELMAALGVSQFSDLIGRSDWLDRRPVVEHWKAAGIDLSRILELPQAENSVAIRNCERQQHDIQDILDRRLIAAAKPALQDKQPVELSFPVCNRDRTVGAMLSGEIARWHGHAGLPDDAIRVSLTGTAGQSFGAFLARGVTLDLVGEANDYVGKGLSGGRLVVRPPKGSLITPEESIIIGNTALYGAIAGECYLRGVAGERFAVRNSGAIAVVEGAGDHCCEYMTGGVVVVLGPTGRNFAAGMSGGVAYVLDEDGDFTRRCNQAMVEIEQLEPEAGNGLARSAGDEHADLAVLTADMLGNDVARLNRLIANHFRYTASTVARRILDNWEDMISSFVRVMPTDYRRALETAQSLPGPSSEVRIADHG